MAKPVSYSKTPEDEDVVLEMVEPSFNAKGGGARGGGETTGMYFERSGSKKKIDYVLVYERCLEKEDEDEESRAKAEQLEEKRKAFEASLDKAGLMIERVERPCSKGTDGSENPTVRPAARPVPTRDSSRPSEDEERKRENQRVEEFLKTLDQEMVLKLCTRALQRGVGSMDFVDSLLIMEDSVDSDDDQGGDDQEDDSEVLAAPPSQQPPAWRSTEPIPEWCKCNNCRNMSNEIENVCCKKRKCITELGRFQKLCLDSDVLDLCIKNRADIRNDREDSSTRVFRKAAYRQYILDKYGYLGKGRRKVAPSCVVWCIRHHYPSTTGVYMGFRSH